MQHDQLRLDHARTLLQQAGVALSVPEGAPPEVELQAIIDALCELSERDALTGLPNRRAFLARVTQELDRSARAGETALLVMIDIDHFKSVNDRHGHAAGDAVLRAVAHALQSAVRPMDTVARLGGEEFGVVFPNCAPSAGAALAERLRRPVQGVLRSGCYITHDHGHYRRLLQQVEQREGLQDSLRPALEVWTHVQSVPEPGLALLTCGRRDISYDIEMPMPLRHLPRGAQNTSAAPAAWAIRALNDQHAYLHFDPAAPGATPAVGDRVVLGLSHPCTTFDKWRWMPVVDGDGTVTGAIHTCF